MTFIKKVSFVIQLSDDFTKGDIIGTYKLFIDSKVVKPIKVVKGMLVYMNLPNDQYDILIKSKYYMTKKIIVYKNELNELNPLVKIYLNPSSVYPFGRYDSVINFNVCDEISKKSLENVEVICHIVSKEYYIGKLKKGIGPGDKCLEVALLDKDLDLQSTYALVSKEDIASVEINEKISEGYSVDKYRGQPVEKGSLICPAINTVTDKNGNGIIYFNKFRNSSVNLVLVLSYEGKSKIIHSELNEYQTLPLGQLTL